MKKNILLGLLISATSFLLVECKTTQKTASKDPGAILNSKEADRIERVLSADDMRGRRAFTPDIDKAADFIADEFKKAGLQTMTGNNGFRQEFAMVRAKFISVTGSFDGEALDAKDIIVVTCLPQLKFDEVSDFEKTSIKAGGNLFAEA